MNEQTYNSTNLNRLQGVRHSNLTQKQPKSALVRELSRLKAQALRMGLFRVYLELNKHLWREVIGKK